MRKTVTMLAVLAIAAFGLSQETGGAAEETGGAGLETGGAGLETGAAALPSEGTIIDVAAETFELGSILTLIEQAGLDELLSSGEYTLFAPDNDAFGGFGELSAVIGDEAVLEEVLSYHVVEGIYTAADLADGDTLTTLQGGELTVSVEGDTVTVGGATVVTPDLEASNGVIHVIDAVLVPQDVEIEEEEEEDE